MFALLIIVVLFLNYLTCISVDIIHHEYIILGAGPSGLQMGYLMQHFDSDKSNDYLIIERNSVAGNFFNKYPRHERLLSINKVYTGNDHHEFNLRHDWNSLLTPKKNMDNKFTNNINSDEYKMRFANYSEEYYPNRKDLAKYLSDFSNYYELNILYNAEIKSVEQDELNDGIFLIDVEISDKPQNIYENRNNKQECKITQVRYSCNYLFVGTGLSKPNIPPIPGIDKATSYSEMSLNINDYKNKRIAVLGGKNSAFETAQWVSTVSAHTHIFPILMPRFSYETHYVGDVRSINMEFLDHYLLKSLDAITEQTILQIEIVYNKENKTFTLPPKEAEEVYQELQRPWPLRGEYDEIIYCTGFLFECDIFSEEICAKLIPNPRKVRYPVINNQYAAKRIKNMYFLGGLMHSVDWKKSAGGFIHGYRYLIKSIFHQIVEKSYKNTKLKIELNEITKYFMIRMNTASSYYQMFSVMGDIVVIRRSDDDELYAEYYYDLLISQINSLNDNNDECVDIITMTFDYNEEFIGHDTVLYDRDRVVQDYRKSKDAKFLHPVLRYYSCKILKNRNDNSYQDYASSKYKISQRHVIEDFLTLWDSKKFHVQWLAKWIKKITKVEQIEWQYSTKDLLDAYN